MHAALMARAPVEYPISSLRNLDDITITPAPRRFLLPLEILMNGVLTQARPL